MGVCPLLLLLGLALGASAQDYVPITGKKPILLYHSPKILFSHLSVGLLIWDYNISFVEMISLRCTVSHKYFCTYYPEGAAYVVIHVKVICIRATWIRTCLHYYITALH